ncbi:MAG: hypothetical protein O7G87_18800 [bacterium]|nr:hypothetical protein [bacterium]
MLSKLFIKKRSGPKLSPLARTLLALAEMEPSSANCTLLQTAAGETSREDLGRVHFFKTDNKLLIRERAIFVTTPDGIKAENRDNFKGNGEILSLWFLFGRVPRIIECRVDGRQKFDPNENVDPKVGVGYKLTPLSEVLKQDKRSSLRFSHLPGQGTLPVYPQVLFDLYIHRTNQTFPEEGAIHPWIENLKTTPPEDTANVVKEIDLESLVQEFKQSIRTNISEDRNVHVSKPFLEEKFNRSVLIELGFSDVLGLGSEDIGRNLHIKKPMSSYTKDRRDPHYLRVEDPLVLHYGSRGGLDGQFRYFELLCEVSKGGLENLTIRPTGLIHQERGFKVRMDDFSVNGIRFENGPGLLEYILGENHRSRSLDEQTDRLHSQILLFNFYPRLRFNRETDAYRPHLPKRISILGRIVRCTIEWEDEEEQRGGKIKDFGVQFMYYPVAYSRDHHRFERWEMIRPFKENRYFKEVHKSLNGLIAFLESQLKE